MRVGVLTGGGDCPGLNAVIRGIVRRGIDAHGFEFFGFRYGWAGVLAGEGRELTNEETKGILPRGGTILGTSRTRSEEHTSELQSPVHLVCRLLLEKKKTDTQEP